MTGYIYEIRNLFNSKIHIGSTQDIENRRKGHYSELEKNIHTNHYLQNSWNKYGKNNFEFNIVVTAIDVTRDELYEIEADYRERLNSYIPNGYNISRSKLGPPNHKGTKRTEKEKENMRKAYTEERRIKMRELSLGKLNHFYGEHHTEATKKIIREKRKLQPPRSNYHPSPETIEKMKRSLKGRKSPMEGKHHLPEARQKMREAKLGTHLCESAIQKLKDFNTGKVLTPEHCKKN